MKAFRITLAAGVLAALCAVAFAAAGAATGVAVASRLCLPGPGMAGAWVAPPVFGASRFGCPRQIPFSLDEQTGTLRIAEASINRGTLTRVVGRSLILREQLAGIVRTVSINVPVGARVRRDRSPVALSGLRPGELVSVLVSPYGSLVEAGR